MGKCFLKEKNKKVKRSSLSWLWKSRVNIENIPVVEVSVVP